MAIRGISMAETANVILKSDPGHPDHPEYAAAIAAGNEVPAPTIFIVGAMTTSDRIELSDTASSSPQLRDGAMVMQPQRAAKAFATVRRCLKGWENMLGADDQPVPFTTETFKRRDGTPFEGADDATLSTLPMDVIIELAEEISERNGLEASVAKKLALLSQQSGESSSLGSLVQAAHPTSKG